MRPQQRRRVVLASAVMAAVALVSTACTSSANESSGDGPIKIGIMLPIDAQGFTIKGSLATAEIATMAINDQGGVNGRKVELVPCDDKNDASTAATCAQKLLREEEVVALAGTASLVSAPLYPVLQSANTVSFGNYPLTPPDLQNERSYTFNGGIAGWGPVAGAIDSEGLRKAVVITTQGPAADAIYPAVKSVLQTQGVSSDLIAMPLQITNFAPIAAKVASLGAEAIVMATPVSQIYPIYQALKAQGLSSLPVHMSGANLTDDVIKNLTASSFKANFGLQFIADPTKSPVRKEYEDQVAKYGSQVGGILDYRNDLSVNSWLAVTKLAEILSELDKVDGPTLKAYLDKQSAFDTGLTHPLDFTKPASQQYPRSFNNWATAGELVDGEIVQKKVDWVAPTSNG